MGHTIRTGHWKFSNIKFKHTSLRRTILLALLHFNGKIQTIPQLEVDTVPYSFISRERKRVEWLFSFPSPSGVLVPQVHAKLSALASRRAVTGISSSRYIRVSSIPLSAYPTAVPWRRRRDAASRRSPTRAENRNRAVEKRKNLYGGKWCREKK